MTKKIFASFFHNLQNFLGECENGFCPPPEKSWKDVPVATSHRNHHVMNAVSYTGFNSSSGKSRSVQLSLSHSSGPSYSFTFNIHSNFVAINEVLQLAFKYGKPHDIIE